MKIIYLVNTSNNNYYHWVFDLRERESTHEEEEGSGRGRSRTLLSGEPDTGLHPRTPGS